MSDSMVERVAAALRQVPVDPDLTKPHAHGLYERMACAAIEAMREPTQEMLSAEIDACGYYNTSGTLGWHAMIDAALKD